MVTKRLPVGIEKVNWNDGQAVTRNEMRDEQARHVDIDAANVANLHGSGVVTDNAVPSVILDTNSLNSQQQVLFDGYSFDGQNVYVGTPLTGVSDSIQGEQLSVTLSDVDLAGSETTRIAIFGDTFGDTLIHDELTFHENGTQITRGRYKSIRGILFNNFAGNLRGSRSPALDGYSFSGRCIIRETESLEASFDHIVSSQTKQPSMFFNEFQPASFTDTPTEMIQDAIGADASISDLGIGLSGLTQRELSTNDVTTRIGQKFLASGTNIQKISILAAVQQDTTVPEADAYNWSGSIVLTLHALQTEVDCPVDPTPDNAIDFDPDPSIIAQLSLDKDAVEKQGVVLDGYSRKVDFVLTGTSVADPSNTTIIKDRYYILTVGRSGDASVGTLLFEEAADKVDTEYMSVYDGSQWINIRESDMWYTVEGDYVKVADGIAYEDGVGVEVPKIKADSTNTEVPYVEGLVTYFTSTKDAYNYILVEQESEFSDPDQDQRTGNQIYQRVAPAPSISLITQSSLDTLLTSTPAPVLLGRAVDGNSRGNPATISGTTALVGLALGDTLSVLNPDADLINNNVVGSELVPNTGVTKNYRIIQSTLVTDSYGDINGDGVIDADDLAILSQWVVDGYFATPLSTAATQQQILDGVATVDQVLRGDVNGDGIIDATDVGLLTQYINKEISALPVGSSFTRMELKVENVLDPLDAAADIPGGDSTFTTTVFTSVPWDINYCATWVPDLLTIEDLRREMPTVLTEEVSSSLLGGRNDLYVPGNMLIEGLQLNPDGTSYSVDFEVNHLSLTMPTLDSNNDPLSLDGYNGLLLFDNFVAESSLGKTTSGFSAMKYSDGTYVQIADFAAGKVKIVPALQSIANEYSVAADIEDIVGMNYDSSTSLLTIYVNNIFDDGCGNVLPPRTMKISVVVYLKKAGFANATSQVTAAQMLELLGV